MCVRERFFSYDSLLPIPSIIHARTASSSFLKYSLTDPMMWSLDDVQRWVRWTCRKYNYRDDCWSLFNVTGEIMCRMSEDDFRWRAPEAGNCLYHQLEAWKLGEYAALAKSR